MSHVPFFSGFSCSTAREEQKNDGKTKKTILCTSTPIIIIKLYSNLYGRKKKNQECYLLCFRIRVQYTVPPCCFRRVTGRACGGSMCPRERPRVAPISVQSVQHSSARAQDGKISMNLRAVEMLPMKKWRQSPRGEERGWNFWPRLVQMVNQLHARYTIVTKGTRYKSSREVKNRHNTNNKLGLSSVNWSINKSDRGWTSGAQLIGWRSY